MRIIHLGHVPPPENHPERKNMGMIHSGRWVLNHAIAQKRAGMDVEVVTQAHKAKCDFICEMEGVKVHFLRTFHPYRHFTFYAIDQFRMAAYAKKLHPDIVHAHGTEAAYALAAIRTKLPFCVTAQGLFFQIFPTLGAGMHLNERFIRMSEHWAWKHTHFAVAKSKYVAQALSEKYTRLDIELIPNTYAQELDDPINLDDSAKRHRSLVYVGTIDERKGVHLIADAMPIVAQRFMDVSLHVFGNRADLTDVGDYESIQLSKLRATLGDRLILHGRQPSSKVFPVLDECTVLLAPSLEEMFGNQLIEGLMRGCHGIVTDRTALAENVRRFGNGTVIPQNDPTALANAICERLTHPSNAVQIESTRQKIREYMSPMIVAKKHETLYKRITKRSDRIDVNQIGWHDVLRRSVSSDGGAHGGERTPDDLTFCG